MLGDKKHLIEYGYKSDRQEVPPEYLVKITSFKNDATVVGIIQKDVVIGAISTWAPFIPIPTIFSQLSNLTQLFTGGRKSLVTKATSRRIWTGTTPLRIDMKLHFETIDDAFQDVVMPCKLLQAMYLPMEDFNYKTTKTTAEEISGAEKAGESIGSLGGIVNKLPTLCPPGPTPFTLEGVLNSKSYSEYGGTFGQFMEGLKGGDKIIVEIGKFLTFWNVIIKEAPVTYYAKFDSRGNPVTADVNVVFETYEMLTVEDLDRAYQKTQTTVL